MKHDIITALDLYEAGGRWLAALPDGTRVDLTDVLEREHLVIIEGQRETTGQLRLVEVGG